MAVIDKLRELGEEIQKDERYLKFRAAAGNNDKDADLQDKIGKLNLILANYNQEAEKGEQADNDKIQKLNVEYGSIYEEIMKNPNMQAYQQAQAGVEEMANYISKMIGCFLNNEDPATCEPAPEEHDCSGGCSSCSGCH